MKKQLFETNGTIANHLTNNADKLWACGSNIRKMRAVALSLLEDPKLTDKEAVAKAKHLFITTKDNLFMSCLVTYMTGMKVA